MRIIVLVPSVIHGTVSYLPRLRFTSHLTIAGKVFFPEIVSSIRDDLPCGSVMRNMSAVGSRNGTTARFVLYLEGTC